MDLLDLYRPGSRLSLRKAGVLIGHLPPESATATALRNEAADSGQASNDGPERDPSEGQWAMQELLLASLIDELRWYRYEFRAVNSKDAGPAPQPVQRPGVSSKKRRSRLTLEQMKLLDPRMR
jgi:hypothetical protein